MRKIGVLGAIACVSLASVGIANAEETGAQEYQTACASCHGVSGEGDGPMVEHLKLTVPSLTGLAAANDGVFPMLKVIHAIDGRMTVRGHGNPMPVWGRQFEAQAEHDNLGTYGGEIAVRGRVLSIAYYLESIQK